MAAGNKEFLGEMRYDRQFTSIFQVTAIGISILMGLLFLLVDQTVVLAGVEAPWAGLVVTLFLGLTMLSVVELLAGSSERGGTYVLIHEIFAGLPSFLTGLSILAASLALAAALARVAVDQILLFFPKDVFSSTFITMTLVGVLVMIQLIQIMPRRVQLWAVTFPLFFALIAVLLSTVPDVNRGAFTDPARFQLKSLNQAVAWLSSAYLVFEALLSSRRLIHSSTRNLPNAILRTGILMGALLIVSLLLAIGLRLTPYAESTSFINSLGSAGFLPGRLINLIAIAAMILAANGAITTAARQIQVLSLEGGLPRIFNNEPQSVSTSIPLFGVMVFIMIPMILFVPVSWLVSSTSGLFLAVIIALNAAMIYSNKVETERRRSFKVPFAPLAPALAIAAGLILLGSLPANSLLTAAGWVLLGVGIYFLYARQHQVEAQTGEIVFGRQVIEHKAKKDRYRILVPIGPNEPRHRILGMAYAIAHQLDGEVIPLQVIVVPDPLAVEEGQRIARERNTLFRWSTKTADHIGVPVYPITRLARSVPEGIIDTAAEEACNLVLMSWPIDEDPEEERVGSVLSRVARSISSDVAVLAYRVDLENKPPESPDQGDREEGDQNDWKKFHPKRILVPTAGGPHAPLAIQIALLLAREYNATVGSVYIAGENATEEQIETGEEQIRHSINTMRSHAASLPSAGDDGNFFQEFEIEGEVYRSESIVSGIIEAGKEYDLVMIGASEESIIDQELFGNLPEKVAMESPSPVMIIKRYRGLPRQVLLRGWNTLYESLPTLDREEQIQVYRSIHRGARPDTDFFVMISLSAIIASFGLLLDSTAVIIGAMLVAPLFSPLLAVSLAIVQGNMRLLRLAVESSLKGIFLAIGLSGLLALILPVGNITAEIAARTEPTLFDLIVALASGVAGAYAVARKDVAAALPGVAIAAALVPPLGVVGIGLANGDLAIAGGSGLLLMTNLIAIALSGSLTFLLLGFRPGAHGTREINLRLGLTTTITLFVLITIPLAVFFIQSLETSSIRKAVQNTVETVVSENSNMELVSPDQVTFEDRDEFLQVTVPVYVYDDEVSPEFMDELRTELRLAVDRPVLVRVVSYPITVSAPTTDSE